MDFYDITEEQKAFPGEYLLYMPTKQIVLCGAYKRIDGTIKALNNGQLLEDKIEKFKKIRGLNSARKKGCGGCKG